MSDKIEMPNHAFPKDYLVAQADKIHKMNPSFEIVYNAIKDIFCSSYTRGYNRKQLETTFFRRKRNARYANEWKEIRDMIDDKIHSKSNL